MKDPITVATDYAHLLRGAQNCLAVYHKSVCNRCADPDYSGSCDTKDLIERIDRALPQKQRGPR